MSVKLFKWGNLVALLLTIVMNGLAERLPFNGVTTGEISAKFPVLITPAPYTFSIWGLIYLLLLLFAIYQLSPRRHKLVERIGFLFMISCLFNVGWIVFWHYLYNQVWLSLIPMIGLLLSLIFIFNNIRKEKKPAKSEQWLARLPMDVYLGWISVATIVNVTVVLYDLEWNGFGLSEVTWTLILLGVGSILAWLIGVPYRTPVYMLVFVWAYVGIAIANRDINIIYYTALGLAALLALLAITVPFRPRNQH